MNLSLLRRVVKWITTPSAFYLMSGLFILEHYYSRERSKLDSPFYAPENLRGAAHSFELSLAAERHFESIENLRQTKAWTELQDTLSGYTEQLALYQRQDTQRRYIIMGLYLLSVLGLRRSSSVGNDKSSPRTYEGEQTAGANG